MRVTRTRPVLGAGPLAIAGLRGTKMDYILKESGEFRIYRARSDWGNLLCKRGDLIIWATVDVPCRSFPFSFCILTGFTGRLARFLENKVVEHNLAILECPAESNQPYANFSGVWNFIFIIYIFPFRIDQTISYHRCGLHETILRLLPFLIPVRIKRWWRAPRRMEAHLHIRFTSETFRFSRVRLGLGAGHCTVTHLMQCLGASSPNLRGASYRRLFRQLKLPLRVVFLMAIVAFGWHTVPQQALPSRPCVCSAARFSSNNIAQYGYTPKMHWYGIKLCLKTNASSHRGLQYIGLSENLLWKLCFKMIRPLFGKL